ncbi:MAG TPA: hypothetical protein VGC21_21885 [Telluria sp.]|jgi:hypothetical protein
MFAVSCLASTGTQAAAAGQDVLRAPYHDFSVGHRGGEDIVIPTEQTLPGACVAVELPGRTALVLVSRTLLAQLAAATVNAQARPGDPDFMTQHHKSRASKLLATVAPSPAADAPDCARAFVDHDTSYLIGALLDRGQVVVRHPDSAKPVPSIVARLRVDPSGGTITYHFPEAPDGTNPFFGNREWISR